MKLSFQLDITYLNMVTGYLPGHTEENHEKQLRIFLTQSQFNSGSSLV
jgi:hypothetical protein